MTAAQVRVCVIGAGAAGLCAARHLASKNNLIPTVFEQSDVVGGTWVYNEQVGVDSHNNPIHSSMYKSMRTNLPKEVMAFPDFPFPSTNHSFLHHTEVRAYLDKYTDHFDVRKYIRFNTSIRHVSPVNNSAGWMITVENLSTGETTTSNFEAVVVCNGHYSVPNIPDDLIGLDTFRGLKMHSHDYRHPGLFEGKSVIVLGAAASGLDIGLEVASTAKKVYLSHNGPPHPSELPGNMVQVAGVTEVIEPHDGGVLLSDGSTVKDVDVILFCTGYHYSFPFLDKRCGLQIENRTVTPRELHSNNVLHV
jgi:cation diffusion facilitator CzcD-associated flavoprotein CzcO